jgi:hypothetical protein
LYTGEKTEAGCPIKCGSCKIGSSIEMTGRMKQGRCQTCSISYWWHSIICPTIQYRKPQAVALHAEDKLKKLLAKEFKDTGYKFEVVKDVPYAEGEIYR